VALGWAMMHGLSSLRLPTRNTMKAAATIFVLILGASQSCLSIENIESARHLRSAQLASLQRTIEQYKGALVIGCYRVRDFRYAIQFAMESVASEYATQLSRMQPEYLSYNRWNGSLYTGSSWLQLSHLNRLIAQGQDVLMLLPGDVNLPQVDGQLLVQVSNGDRILKVFHVAE
jgi:hypothetical protein